MFKVWVDKCQGQLKASLVITVFVPLQTFFIGVRMVSLLIIYCKNMGCNDLSMKTHSPFAHI
ncbi:hypothetical protein DLD82_01810 [Methanospirillum stamsii]|uniref:Uncharacterized protein n=1 Tax=Methanospirillum stamsii TaxID=1277351 RepID=A0A2V2NHG9_9EURY|nr:hypothetical protein DLD82_01810 [Methanospirillum stamsii]